MILRSPVRRSRRAADLTTVRRARHPARRTIRHLAVALLVPLALAACTNSKLVVAPLYNRLDDRIRGEFEKLGDFDERQTALFEAAVGTAHVWHRQAELPAYARLLDEIAASIARPGVTTPADVARWGETIEAHAIAARECHPVNFSFELMRSLDDEEIDHIEQHLARERKKHRERHYSRTPEERVEYRLKNLRKWAGRIGVDLTAGQAAMLRTALGRQISLRREYYLLSDRWNAKLFRLARERQAPNYDARMAAHFGELWTLLEKAYPEAWEKNRALWRDIGYRLVESMNAEQREAASEWLDKMGGTLDAISRDEPSFEVGDDPSIGCLAGAAATGASNRGADATG